MADCRAPDLVHFTDSLRRTACGLTIIDTDLQMNARTSAGEHIRVTYVSTDATCPRCLGEAQRERLDKKLPETADGIAAQMRQQFDAIMDQ